MKYQTQGPRAITADCTGDDIHAHRWYAPSAAWLAVTVYCAAVGTVEKSAGPKLPLHSRTPASRHLSSTVCQQSQRDQTRQCSTHTGTHLQRMEGCLSALDDHHSACQETKPSRWKRGTKGNNMACTCTCTHVASCQHCGLEDAIHVLDENQRHVRRRYGMMASYGNKKPRSSPRTVQHTHGSPLEVGRSPGPGT